MTRDDFIEELRQKIIEELTQEYRGHDMYMDSRRLAQKEALALTQSDEYVDLCFDDYRHRGVIAPS